MTWLHWCSCDFEGLDADMSASFRVELTDLFRCCFSPSFLMLQPYGLNKYLYFNRLKLILKVKK